MALSISETGRRRAIVAVVLFAAAAADLRLAAVARAQPAAAASDATRAAARAKLVEGVAALKRGDHQAALARFEEAYALVPSPKIHYDFGLAYMGLGRTADALAAFERFLAEARDAPVDKRDKAASMVSTLRARMAETGVTRNPDVVAATPALMPPPPVTAEQPATSTPAPPPPPAALAEERAPSPSPPDGDPLRRRRRIAALSLGGAGVGLVAAGLVFGVLAQREDDSLTDDSQMGTPERPTPFDLSKESRGITYERLQVIGLVAGVLAVAGGVALYATSRARVVVEPVAGPSVAGANLRVRF
jgi:hypothetical protein